MRVRLLTLFFLLLVSPGCAWVLWPYRGVPTPLQEVRFDDVSPLIDDSDRESLRIAIERSIEFYQRKTAHTFMAGGQPYSGAEFAAALNALLAVLARHADSVSLDAALRSSFRVLRATGRNRSVRFTGYYTPVIRASLERGGPYQYPIYGRPPDLITFDLSRLARGCECATGMFSGHLRDGSIMPYHSRSVIERNGVLSGLGLEIAWTDDPVGLFFLHIQGSGQLLLPDGQVLQANYAGTNGHPYTSVGRILASRGALPAGGGSMQLVRDYLASHPFERDAVLRQNQRYTFFRIAETGPVGSIEVEVTAGRSIATDPTVFPPGALAYIRTQVPVIDESDHSVTGWAPLRRLVLNQDAGSAITGPERVDIYFGTGKQAEGIAGRMAAEGELYFLVPRTAEVLAARGT